MLWTNNPREKYRRELQGEFNPQHQRQTTWWGNLQGVRYHMKDLRPVLNTGEDLQKGPIFKLSDCYAKKRMGNGTYILPIP